MEQSLENKVVLVTGGTGYVASYCIKYLLERNCRVRSTVRSLSSPYVQEFYQIFKDKKDLLQFVEGDLLNESQWDEIVKGCDYVLHVASPINYSQKDAQKTLDSALNGTRNVLMACVRQKISKVVMTSSIAAVYSKVYKNQFDHNDWTPDDCILPYHQSKLQAEKEAWKISKKYGLNLTTINPTRIQGGSILSRETPSYFLITLLLKSPFIPYGYVSMVDIQDVAMAHIRSLERPSISNGKRYILNENTYEFKDIITVLKSQFPQYHFGYVQTPRFMQKMILKTASLFGYPIEDTSIYIYLDTSLVRKDLGIQFTCMNKYIIERVYGCIKSGLIKNKIKQFIYNELYIYYV